VAFWVPLLRPIQMLIMGLYFRSTVSGRDRVPRKGPVILCPTHRTRWDTVVLYSAVRGRLLRWLTSHDEVMGFQGSIVRQLGAFPINTRRPTPGALKHCAEILKAGEALVIFPEGDIFRLPPGQVHPIKPGTAWLALQVQKELGETPLEIVPVRLGFGMRFVRFRCPVSVDVREPIRVASYAGLPRDQAIAALTADLQRELGDEVNPMGKKELEALGRGEAPTTAVAGPSGGG
jgi:1-acyl-sn-glycerol-3-phosphate acyltransferase